MTLEIDQKTMTVLRRVAQARGVDIEIVTQEWVQNQGENEESVRAWMELAGIFNSQHPDLSERHDHYLAEEAMNTHVDA